MSRLPIRWKPQGIIPRDVSLTLRMQNSIPSEVIAPPPCEAIFRAWRVVTTNFISGEAINVTGVFPEGNLATPIPYQDGCFDFNIFLVGELCPGQCLEWSATFADSFGNPQILDSFNIYTDPFFFVAGDGCRGCRALYNTTFPSSYGTLVGSTLQLNAAINGAQFFGPSISFACNPAAYATSFVEWFQEMLVVATQAVTSPQTTFQQVPDGTLRYALVLGGTMWDNAPNITWTISQIAGTAIPDPSYFTLSAVGCSEWDVGLVDGYDYTGTSFTANATYKGNPFGSTVTWSCEV